MSKKTYKKPVFKPYDQQQLMLLPPSLDELIIANHPVRVVNEVINKIDIKPLLSKYEGGGTSSYHPQMLLKVMVYAYMNNIYSSRKIEEALQQNIHFMWLSGMNTPDHHTINRFRGHQLSAPLKKIFTEVVKLFNEEGLLSIKDIFTDGTKIEANANRYTFVWGNSIKKNKEKMKEQLNEMWEYAQSVAAEELSDSTPTAFTEVNKENVKTAISKIDEALKDKPVNKKFKQKLQYAKTKWPEALDKYALQEAIIGDKRNSYSKTDIDATFMRMKEDHMMNGQLKPAYNVQVSTSNQYIANYTTHQTPVDITTLKEHIEEHKAQYNKVPEAVTTDAGYGSEENYEYLEKEEIKAYVKYNQFDREQNDNIQTKTPFSSDKLYYNEQQDFYVCPMGQRMNNIGTYVRETTTGFKQTITKYQAKNCSNCPLQSVCYQSKGNRIIEINHNLNRHKEEAKNNLLSEEGVKHRKKRCCDVEPVFGNIKSNHHFKRFMLRGKVKVTTEVGLLALAHNLRKKSQNEMEKAA